MLLQVVTDPGDVGGDFNSVGQSHTGDLPERRIRLLRRLRFHLHTHPAPLRARLERRARGLVLDLLSSFADQLIDSRHNLNSQARQAHPAPALENFRATPVKRVPDQLSRDSNIRSDTKDPQLAGSIDPTGEE